MFLARSWARLMWTGGGRGEEKAGPAGCTCRQEREDSKQGKDRQVSPQAKSGMSGHKPWPDKQVEKAASEEAGHQD